MFDDKKKVMWQHLFTKRTEHKSQTKKLNCPRRFSGVERLCLCRATHWAGKRSPAQSLYVDISSITLISNIHTFLSCSASLHASSLCLSSALCEEVLLVEKINLDFGWKRGIKPATMRIHFQPGIFLLQTQYRSNWDTDAAAKLKYDY